jgi:DNA-binding transcriptional ArsR family regulator
MKHSLDQLVQLLRSAAEPTRLRILALLADGERSVSDVAAVLGQSQPRVSRHLRVLCDAGLLSRTREQHWIYYRLDGAGAHAEFVRSILGSLNPGDPVLTIDVERSGRLCGRRTEGDAGAAIAPTGAPDEGAELGAVLVEELGDAGRDALLYLGDAQPGALADLSARVHRIVVLRASPEEPARRRLAVPVPARVELRQGDLRALPFGGATFDAVIIDRVPDLDAAHLREAARVLRPDGRLIVIDDYDRLDARGAGANPLLAARERLTRADLACARLRPLDLATARLLLSIAAAATRGAAAA